MTILQYEEIINVIIFFLPNIDPDTLGLFLFHEMCYKVYWQWENNCRVLFCANVIQCLKEMKFMIENNIYFIISISNKI